MGGTSDLNFQDAEMAEAASICAALVTCIKEGLDCIEIESEAKTIIQMVNKEVGGDATIEFFLHDILYLARTMRSVELFVPRNGN